MTTDVSTLSEDQLKALAYDNLLEKERIEKNLQIINQELTRRIQEKQTEETPKGSKSGKA